MSWLMRGVTVVVATLAAASVGAEQLLAFLVKPGNLPPHEQTLHRIAVSYDPQAGYTAGRPVTVGLLGIVVNGISLSPSGRLLGLDSANSRLVDINTGTGLAIPLVNLELPPSAEVYDLAVDPSGRGWLVGVNASYHSTLFRLDLATGHVTPVGEMGLTYTPRSLTWLGDTLYALSEDVYSVDPTTGQAALVAPGCWTWWHTTCLQTIGSDTHGLWYVDCTIGEPAGSYYQTYGVYDLASGQKTQLGSWGGISIWGCERALLEVLPIGGASAPIPALGSVGIAVLVLLIAGGGVVLLRRG